MGCDGVGHGQVDRGPEDARVVANVAAEQHERVWAARGPGQAAQVAYCVPGAVQEVEGAVAKVVEGFESPNCEGVLAGEVNLDELSASFADVSSLSWSHGVLSDLRVVAFQERRVRVRREAREQALLESRPNDQVRGGGEGGRISDVVPVPMTVVSQISVSLE